MSLTAVVKGREEGDSQWKEVVDIITFSATGSSFDFPRQCEVGTLLSLMIPLPTHMRSYDFNRKLYRVWGLVQHCEAMSSDDGPPTYHLGVAFIGKDCPESYDENPMQHYRICGVDDDDGMWRVEESKTPFKKRNDVRFWTQVDLYLAHLDARDDSKRGERTTAENVSRSGAAVFTTMNVNIGDRVKFISEEYDFSGLAVVCNRQQCVDGRSKVHLKFVKNTFPVEFLMNTDAVFEKIQRS
jgi:hypothetical protein